MDVARPCAMKTIVFAMLLVTVLTSPSIAQQNPVEGYQRLAAKSTLYAAPPEYEKWWSEVVKDCGCEPQVRLSDIWWMQVNAATFDCIEHDGCHGSYWPDMTSAFIRHDDIHHAMIVKHEMLHAILGGDPQHAHKAWGSDVLMRLARDGRW